MHICHSLLAGVAFERRPPTVFMGNFGDPDKMEAQVTSALDQLELEAEVVAEEALRNHQTYIDD